MIDVMKRGKIRVLVVDDDVDFCFVQKSHLNMQHDMVCCGVAHDGRTALRMIEALQPDVVLLDHVMPLLDGLGVLEYAKERPFAKQPRFLVTSANGQEHIMREMMLCGADYFLEKPFEQETLVRRIRFVYRVGNGRGVAERDELVEKLIAQTVLAIGVPTKRLGYEYIKEAVYIFLRAEHARPTLKEVYAMIAERHTTESRCVENAIASALKAALTHRTEALQRVLALSPTLPTDSVSNGKFLTLLVQSIQLQQG